MTSLPATREARPYLPTLGGVLVAIVTTTVGSMLGASPTANLVVAVLAAVLPTFVTFVGPWWHLRLGVGVAAAVAALFVTFGGLTLFDAAADERTVPWSNPEPTAEPHRKVALTGGGRGDGGGSGRPASARADIDPDTVSCTAAGECSPDVKIRSVGSKPLRIAKIDFPDDPEEHFGATGDCVKTIAAGDVCSFSVTYAAGTNGDARASLVIEHDGGPTRISLEGDANIDMRPVPSVEDLSYDSARSTLRAAGFVVRRMAEESSDEPPGQVVAQDPRGEESRPVNSTVTLWVSQGPSTQDVPDVLQAELGSARAQLEELGFAVEVSQRSVDSADQDGIVVGQDPPGGSVESAGTPVKLVVGRFEPEAR